MRKIDEQLRAFRQQLCGEVKLGSEEADKVATLIAADIRFLPIEAKRQIRRASPVPIQARYEELIAFQSWSEFAAKQRRAPEITRASVIVQNYVCFSYLKDACFEVVSKRASPESVSARVASFLSCGAIRDFRNAFSHANWCYAHDFSGLNCWVLEDARKRDGKMRQFFVPQKDLNFWQTLSRAAAYAVYEQLRS